MSAPFDPAYPTEAAQRYRDAFVAGLASAELALPDNLLSYAIDRSLGTSVPPEPAGKCFAIMYWRISKRRKMRDGGLIKASTYILAAFEDELRKLDKSVL